MYGQMNEPPGARARVALTGLTVAEYFRDQEGQDVLLFIDNIFRFTQAGSEVSPLDCKMCALFPSLQTLKPVFCVTVHHHLIYVDQLLPHCVVYFLNSLSFVLFLKYAFCLQVSALLGRIPSAVGYQPTLATDMGTMQERITTTKKGSITSVQVLNSAVLVFVCCSQILHCD